MEVEILFKEMLIGVTSFFRDPEAFKVLEEQVIPDFISSREPDSNIRVWVAGCSTGEEAYSIAILFAETMDAMKKHLNIQIFASDIDSQAIDYARQSVYPDSIVADVSQKRLDQFFIKAENTFKIKKHIREMVVFAVQNLIKDPPFSKIDLVSCRNLLIYMNSLLQKRVLPLFHYTLNQNGVLFLGNSESIGEFTNLFSPIDAKCKIFRCKEKVVDKIGDYGMYTLPAPPRDDGKKTGAIDIHSLAEKIVLENYAPPCVLINERYEILHFMGQTDKYLKNPAGKASFNILKMAREGLQYKLSTAIHQAVREKGTVVSKALRVKYDDSYRIVDAVVRPLTETDFTRNFMIVMFEDKTPPETSVLKMEEMPDEEQSDDMFETAIHRELASTKEYLQTTIEELETSNEELKSTNEELQSVNEELQSTNEELETSKEELQSTNEELVTVNTELQKKVDELSEANNDINNLLASTEIGTIFLDMKLCIKRFTPAITKIFNLIQSDIGRPVNHITSNIEYEDIYKDAKNVLRTLNRKEMEIRSKDGTWYDMRIGPYRTVENVIDGVVITFVDIGRVKKAENATLKVQAELEQRKEGSTAELLGENEPN